MRCAAASPGSRADSDHARRRAISRIALSRSTALRSAADKPTLPRSDTFSVTET